jgi:hypothetical protein
MSIDVGIKIGYLCRNKIRGYKCDMKNCAPPPKGIIMFDKNVEIFIISEIRR